MYKLLIYYERRKHNTTIKPTNNKIKKIKDVTSPKRKQGTK